MIHYHGTPAGGNKIDAVRFLQGRHALVSFYYPRDLPVVMDVCSSFILDNGAFSKWKKGEGGVDEEAYTKWVMSVARHPGFDWCLIPDKIDGTEQDNLDMVKRWYKRDLGIVGVPVYHMHESFKYLELLIERFPVIALGSSGEWQTPNSKEWWKRMTDIMNVICDKDGVPRCKLHGLRMLNPKVFTKMPLSSADSTNASVNSGSLKRFGIYLPSTRSQRADVIAERIESHNSSPIWINKGGKD